MIHVTDQALVRFLQRSGALDVEQLRGMIAASLERGRDAAERAGVANYIILVDGLRYVVEDGKLLTVKTDAGHRTGRRPGQR